MIARLLILVCLVPWVGSCDRPGERVRLELWTWALRPTFEDFMGRLVADFEARRPGVEVIWVDVPGDAMQRKMFAAGAAGGLPDVINFSDQHFAQFASLGALRPLDDGLPGEPQGRFVPGALAACRVDGELFGLPWYLSTPVQMVNVGLLTEGGLEPDDLGATWRDLAALAGPFREATGRHLFTLRLASQSELPGLMLADGLRPVVPHENGGYQSNLTDPTIVAFVSDWVELYRQGDLPRSAVGGFEVMKQAYQDGQVAVINANAVKAVGDNAPRIIDQTVLRPGVVGGRGSSGIAVMAVAVTATTEHPELAAELAWHVTSPRWQTELALLASRLPATVESLEDPRFTAEGDLLQQATTISAKQLPDAEVHAVLIGPWPDLRGVFEEGMRSMLIDGADVEATLAAVGVEWDRILRADAAGLPYK